MRNIRSYETYDDALFGVKFLWKTKEFQESKEIQALTVQVAKRMPSFYTMDSPYLEHAHFTTWFGFFALRDYANPYVNDLYWLHEFTHFVNFDYGGGVTDTFHKWYRRMLENEFNSSFQSEALIYFQMPGLRKETFPFEIWVDRHLGFGADGTLGDHFSIQVLRDLRLKAMRDPDPFDFCEQQMAAYVRQNMAWAQTWAKNWRVVEKHMAVVGEGGYGAHDFHQEWVRKNMTDVLISKDDGAPVLNMATFKGRGWDLVQIPFAAEAVAFGRTYDQNKALYGNHF